jgi:hypothetical protein
MKKRAQTPDAQTYTTVFRGLARADHSDHKMACAKALSIYEAMHAPNSPLQPNIIHINAVLNVCARAGEMDALFGIAAKLPLQGMMSANNLTYTIILNAIRASATFSVSSPISEELRMKRQQQAVSSSHRIWSEVIHRLRKDDIFIDEELVCAMGRVLLLGNDQDRDDVLSLVQQCMGIPRLIPELGTPERNAIEPARQNQVEDDVEENDKPDGSFDSIKPLPLSGRGPSYASPGKFTLTLILDALTPSGQKATAKRYWDLFTTHHNVEPDNPIVLSYLRILRVARASSQVVEVLQDTPASIFDPLIYRTALEAALRDKNNKHAFSNAGKILDMMLNNSKRPDPRALTLYLTVALTSKASVGKAEANADTPEFKFAKGKQIQRALFRLQPHFLDMKSYLAYGDPTNKVADVFADAKYRSKALEFVNLMISAYDQLMNNGMVARESYTELMKSRSQLSAFVTRIQKKFPPKDGAPTTRRRPGGALGGVPSDRFVQPVKRGITGKVFDGFTKQRAREAGRDKKEVEEETDPAPSVVRWTNGIPGFKENGTRVGF